MNSQQIYETIIQMSKQYNPEEIYSSFSCQIDDKHFADFYRVGHDEAYDFALGVVFETGEIYKYTEWQTGVDSENDPMMDYKLEKITSLENVGYIGK